MSSLDYNIVKSNFIRFEPKDKSGVKNILNTCRDTEDLLYKLSNIFYFILIVPITDKKIEMDEFTLLTGNYQYRKKNKMVDGMFCYRKNNLTLITTIELLDVEIECYDYNNSSEDVYNNELLDLYYERIKKHFDIIVLDYFRPWSKKKQIKIKLKNKKELKNLPKYHNPIKLYFKDFITEELIMNVMHPRNIGRLWNFEDFYSFSI
jgi:hypothetical protein